MCGRYILFSIDDFTTRFTLNNHLEINPNYNAAPGQSLPVVTRNSPNRLEIMRWGLIPFWAKDHTIGYKTINARAETIFKKASFRKPIKEQRYLVPADSFYEWQHSGKKIPHNIEVKGRSPIAFAGIYDEWHGREGEKVRSYSILTVAADEQMKSLHDRMPLILDPEQEEFWIDAKTDMGIIEDILAHPRHQDLNIYPVSDEVNKIYNNHAGLIERVEPPLTLFSDAYP